MHSGKVVERYTWGVMIRPCLWSLAIETMTPLRLYPPLPADTLSDFCASLPWQLPTSHDDWRRLGWTQHDIEPVEKQCTVSSASRLKIRRSAPEFNGVILGQCPILPSVFIETRPGNFFSNFASRAASRAANQPRDRGEKHNLFGSDNNNPLLHWYLSTLKCKLC